MTLTTATPVDAGNLADFKTRLLASNETAKDVEIITKTDPEIIGGFVLQIGDKLYDNSIAYKLKQIQKACQIKTISKKFKYNN